MVLMPCGNCCCKVSWPGWPYNAPDSIEVDLAASSAKYGTLEWTQGTAKKATIYTPAVASGTYSLAYDSGSGKYKYTEAHSFSIEFSFAYPGGQEEASRLCKSDNTITVKKGPRVVLGGDIKSQSDMASSSWYSGANAWHFLGGSGVNVSPQYWWHNIGQQDDSLTPLLTYASTALTDTETQAMDGYVDVYLPSAFTSFRYPVCVLPMRSIAERVGFSLTVAATATSGLTLSYTGFRNLYFLSAEDEIKVNALRFVYSSGSFPGFSAAIPGCS
jgi:hypothetical protein